MPGYNALDVYGSGHAVPPSASTILLAALEHQDRVTQSVKDEAAALSKAEDTMADRTHLLARLRARRITKMEAVEDEGVAALEGSVEALRQTLRDTPSTLRPDGHQLHHFPNRDVYDGEWHNSNLHGKGRWLAHDANVEYEGDWFLGVRAGNGMFKCRNTNTVYRGRWAEGKRDGKGELFEPEGVYKGDFRENRFHGHGEYVFTDGHRYVGEWADDRFDGSGKYSVPGGPGYEGEWRGGLRHGKGTASYTGQGSQVYTGQWRLGKRHGTGSLVTPDFKFTGAWEHDVRCGHGSCTWATGDVYEGEYKRDEPHGVGRLQAADRALYHGQWHRGKRHGRGVYTAPSGRASYDGGWREDRKHGSGVMTLLLAGSIHGTWVDDALHGPAVFVPKNGEQSKVMYEHGRCVSCEATPLMVKVALGLGARTDDDFEDEKIETEHKERDELHLLIA
jgi:hypothetical protein